MKKLFLVACLLSQLSLGKNIECEVKMYDLNLTPTTLYRKVFLLPVDEKQYSETVDFVDSRISFKYSPFNASSATLVISLYANNETVFETRVNPLWNSWTIVDLNFLSHPLRPLGCYKIVCRQENTDVWEPAPLDEL